MSLPSGSPSRADAVRHAVPFASLAIVVAFAFWPLFERMAWVSRDFSGHLTLARNLLREAAPDSERFGFELLTVLLAGLSDERADLFWAAVVVSTLATVAKALLSARWLARDLAPWRASALALLVLFLAPITFAAQHPLKDDQSAVHLGQISGLIFHNPPTVLVFPFVLARSACWLGNSSPLKGSAQW